MFGKLFKLLSPIQWVELGGIIIILFTVFNFSTTIIDGVKGVFGMETKASLKEQTVKQEAVIRTVVTANESLAQTIKLNETTAKIEKEVIVEKFEADKKVETGVTKIVAKKDKAISVIKSNYVEQPKTVESQAQMEKAVSTEQITSLWTIYCSESGDDNKCKKEIS